MLRVAHADDDATTAGQVLRYLAEIAWVPRAIDGNGAIRWQQLDDRTALGTIEHRGRPLALRFTCDANGDLEHVEGLRDFTVGDERRPTPWRGRFCDYREVDGVRVPTRAEVEWQLEGGAFPYWRGTITSVRCR